MTPQEPTDMGYYRLFNHGNGEDDARLPVLVLQLRNIAPDDARWSPRKINQLT